MEENTIVIDAQGAIFGRLCSFAAKKALQGNQVIIVNAEKTIITGDKNNIVAKYHGLRQKGQKHSLRGPSISKVSYKILKRGIRGMLPNHRWGIGKEALERVICHNG
ncbi:MAG: uL13 family ribosomal protein, partial [Nanoarchaeota archaeon]